MGSSVYNIGVNNVYSTVRCEKYITSNEESFANLGENLSIFVMKQHTMLITRGTYMYN